MPRIGNWKRISEYEWYNSKRKWKMRLLFIWRGEWFASCESDSWFNIIWESPILRTRTEVRKAAIEWMKEHP